MRILPANSEGFGIPIFVSWFCHFLGFLFCCAFVLPFCYHCACVSFCCHYYVLFCCHHFCCSQIHVCYFVVCVSFYYIVYVCRFLAVFLSFSHSARVAISGADLESPKNVMILTARESIFRPYCLSFAFRFFALVCRFAAFFAFARLGVILKYFFISQAKTTIRWRKMTVRF